MRTRTTQKKRQREQAQRERVTEKAARRAERRRVDAIEVAPECETPIAIAPEPVPS